MVNNRGYIVHKTNHNKGRGHAMMFIKRIFFINLKEIVNVSDIDI